MLLSKRIKLALVLWVAGEAIAFFWVVRLIGFSGALLIGFVTSLVGWAVLKRAGASAMVKLRATLEGRAAADAPRLLDDTIATLGALALLMPGFLSDLVGLALAVPAVRKRLGRWAGRTGWAGIQPSGGQPQPGSTIDLDPAQWERTDASRRPITKV